MPRRLDPKQAVERMRTFRAEPLDPYPGSDTPWRCVCLTCGETGYPRLSAMGRQGPCKPCGRKRANSTMRLDSAEAEQIMRQVGLLPVEEYPGTGTSWRCRCLKCGREVYKRVGEARKGSGCLGCAAQKPNPVLQRRSGNAVAAMRDAGLEPLEEFPGSKKPWRSRCLVCGTIGTPRLGGILAGQGGCVPCGQKKAAAAARSRMLDAESTAAEMIAAGLQPLVAYPGSTKPWRCRCMRCGREVDARLWGVRTGKGCRYCATHGIDLTGPTMVYVINHKQWGAVKVGIGACTGYNSRLLQHERSGWNLAYSRRFATGAAALDVEQAVLDRLRAQNLAPFLTPEVMPNGFSETCDAQRITTDELWEMVREAAEDTGASHRQTDGPRRRPSANGLIDPEIAAEQMRAAGFEPLVPYPGRTNLSWPCRCKACGTEGRPRLNSIRNRGSGCRKCRNEAVRAAEVVAKASEAVAVMRKAGFEPLEEYRGSKRPWRSLCRLCGKESTPAYGNVRQGSHCRHCRGHGGAVLQQ
ncbi:hypothetical protein M2284_005276 [Rhodococcus sp. LBL1]|nr:hypothetical protein [Rhodococcus sp. LBL1]MDH6686339.1 hypothetical protein [Rhodococcus sp. LBL2]